MLDPVLPRLGFVSVGFVVFVGFVVLGAKVAAERPDDLVGALGVPPRLKVSEVSEFRVQLGAIARCGDLGRGFGGWSVGVSFGSGIRSIGRGHKVGTARPGERAPRGALEDRRRVNANAEETRTFVLGASRAAPSDRGGGKGFRRAGGDSPMLASTIGCRAGAGGGFGGSGAGSVDVGFSIAPLTHSVAGSDARRYPPRATRSGRYQSLGFHENSYLGGDFKLEPRRDSPKVRNSKLFRATPPSVRLSNCAPVPPDAVNADFDETSKMPSHFPTALQSRVLKLRNFENRTLLLFTSNIMAYLWLTKSIST